MGPSEGGAEAADLGRGLGSVSGAGKEKWILWEPRAIGSNALTLEQSSQEGTGLQCDYLGVV